MKGQVSVEFLVYFTLVLLIGTFFFLNYSNSIERISEIKAENDAEKLLEEIVFEINSAVVSGNGYERRFYLEDTIDGFSNYTITVWNYSVFLDWDGRSKSSRIITCSINGSINKKWNLIRNVNGVVYVD